MRCDMIEAVLLDNLIFTKYSHNILIVISISQVYYNNWKLRETI